MPNHDYHCPDCGALLADQYRSVEEGGQSRLPVCPECGEPMSWVPAIRMDLRTDGSEAFAKFETTDGRGNPVVVDSLHKVRQLEREAEQAARNGEGQSMVFRAYSNDRGNRLDSALGELPPQGPSAAAKAKFGLRGGAKPLDAGGGEPDIPFGPGVTESNTSALKES